MHYYIIIESYNILNMIFWNLKISVKFHRTSYAVITLLSTRTPSWDASWDTIWALFALILRITCNLFPVLTSILSSFRVAAITWPYEPQPIISPRSYFARCSIGQKKTEILAGSVVIFVPARPPALSSALKFSCQFGLKATVSRSQWKTK